MHFRTELRGQSRRRLPVSVGQSKRRGGEYRVSVTGKGEGMQLAGHPSARRIRCSHAAPLCSETVLKCSSIAF